MGRCFRLCATALCLGISALSLAHRAAAQEPPSERQRFKFSGDLRLRGEYDIDRTGNPDRARPRVRFRLAIERELVRHVYVGARAATGSNERDPNSPHQTLGNGFRTYRIALDRVFLRWSPPIEQRLTVYAGKFSNPLAAAPVYGELVWDADIGPEGVAAILEPVPAVRLVAAQYMLLQRSPGKSIGLTSAQATLSGNLSRNLSGTGAVGTYFYQRPDAAGAAFLARENQGNALITEATTGDTLAFASDFDIVHAFALLRYATSRFPITVSGQYVINTSAPSGSDDDGFAVGFEVGRIRQVGSWRVRYQYQDIGRESVFSPFAHDDFLNGTNYRGHLGAIAVQVLPMAHLNLWTLWSATQEPRVDVLQKRFRLDLNVSF